DVIQVPSYDGWSRRRHGLAADDDEFGITLSRVVGWPWRSWMDSDELHQNARAQTEACMDGGDVRLYEEFYLRVHQGQPGIEHHPIGIFEGTARVVGKGLL